MSIHWVLSKVRLSSICPNLWIKVFSYLYKTERGRQPRESSRKESVASDKQNEQWGCLLELLPTLLLPNSSIISSEAIVVQPRVLAFGMSSKGTTWIQKYTGPYIASSSQPLFGAEISSSRWLAKRRGNEGELFGVQGPYLLLHADFERIHASLGRDHSLNKPGTTDLCFGQYLSS